MVKVSCELTVITRSSQPGGLVVTGRHETTETHMTFEVSNTTTNGRAFIEEAQVGKKFTATLEMIP